VRLPRSRLRKSGHRKVPLVGNVAETYGTSLVLDLPRGIGPFDVDGDFVGLNASPAVAVPAATRK